MNDSPPPGSFQRVATSVSRSLKRLARFGNGGGRRRREVVEIIRASSLFDDEWYLQTYPDIAAARVDPLRHYLDTGWREGRDPGPNFCTSAYLKANSDVARAGVNPLVHFLEFGQSEGRDVREHKPAARLGNGAHPKLRKPAPVYRGSIPAEVTAPWMQSHRLSDDDGRLFRIGEWRVGYAEADRRGHIEEAFAGLARLSGYADEPEGSIPAADRVLAFVDAWFVNESQLRLRWSSPELPIVVRAFQHDPLAAGEVKLVGEGLVSTPLDLIDLCLVDPYFPLLFVAAAPEGTIRGSVLLPFPSLCRGGVHYSEFVSRLESGKPGNPLQDGLALARKLVATRCKRRLVASIAVDLSGADGTTPLFRPDFRNWLRQVAGVSVEAAEGVSCDAGDLLDDDPPGVAPSGGTLILGADMIPTIAALAEPAGRATTSETFLPLLIAQPDPSEPATLAALPQDAPDVVTWAPAGYPAPWPRWRKTKGARLAGRFGDAAAIRLARGRTPSESELLVPASGASLPLPPIAKTTITWLVSAADWEASELVDAAKAVAAQSGPFRHIVGFVGGVEPQLRESVASLLRGRVREFEDFRSAALRLEGDLVAFVGPGVILHDPRTAHLLTAILAQAGVESASCPLISTEKRGKSWHVSVVDVGAIPGTDGRRPLAKQAAYGQQMWRSTFPVTAPSRDLWVARRSTVKQWLAPNPGAERKEGVHVCTALVTAAYATRRRKDATTPTPPRASAGTAIEARTLFG